MSKFAIAVFILMLLAVTVMAISQDYQVYDDNFYGYTGQLARDRRYYDPYTRERYFGSDYQRQLVNYGMKGPPNRVLNTGSKSAFSSVFNVDTNSYSNRGRDPSYISNYDPGIRGYTRLDRTIYLLPFEPIEQFVGPKQVIAKGTARILSTGDQYGAGLNQPYPSTQMIIQLINLQPAGDGYVYEAWLLDDETEYALSMGLLKSGVGLTSQFTCQISRLVYMFDKVMITKEIFPDPDPGPGEIVLMGDINKPRIDVTPEASEFDRLR